MRKNILLVYLTLIISAFISTVASSATLDGISMADSITIADKKLVLNGQGTRKATWLKVKVYVGGLYLEKKTSNQDTILDSKGIKHIDMHFVRDVDQKKLADAWIEAFENSVPDSKKYVTKLNSLNSMMKDIKEDEKMLFTFLNDGVELSLQGRKSKIEGGDFSRALLSVWFVKSEDQGLRKGLLGL